MLQYSIIFPFFYANFPPQPAFNTLLQKNKHFLPLGFHVLQFRWSEEMKGPVQSNT